MVFSSGNYAVTVSYTGGCFASAAPILVRVDINPTVSVCPINGSILVAPFTSQIYSVAHDTTVNYTWTVPTGWIIVAGQGTPMLHVTAGTANGNVCLTAGNSCGESPGSPCCLAVTTSVGIGTIAANTSLDVYPNPVNDNLIITINTLEQGADWTISLYDIVGNKIHSEILKAVSGDNQKELNLSTIAKGFYILELQNNGVILTRKVIKQ
jgi:hypothetical protein